MQVSVTGLAQATGFIDATAGLTELHIQAGVAGNLSGLEIAGQGTKLGEQG
jgi:hypothetical protein